MPEASLARRLSPMQREHLSALGVELLELRPVAVVSAPRIESASAASSPTASLRLHVRAPETARSATLLLAVVRALGLQPTEVAHAREPGLPTLAFAPEIDDGVNAPALELLRLGTSKRALWPALRRLRRQLQSPDRPG